MEARDTRIIQVRACRSCPYVEYVTMTEFTYGGMSCSLGKFKLDEANTYYSGLIDKRCQLPKVETINTETTEIDNPFR